ncbi:MAG: winged helix-turn-helix domain-containing protein, partial [Planctomycetota bacterium]|nr:winged helix-turn-helix domain-containing protein [Planctomycetota bacterium]
MKMAANNKKPSRQGGTISNGARKTCKKYELELMHYAGGEYNYIKDKNALEQHLKGCSVCQKVLKGFVEVDTFAAVTREPSKQFQEKMAELKQRAQKGPPGLPPARDTTMEIGLAAGEIYSCLKKNGPIPIPMVRVKTNLLNYPFYEAMGWLDREGRIVRYGDP